MKHKIFTALTVFFCLMDLSAQITKTDGPLEKGAEKPDLPAVIGADNNAFYTFRSNNDKMYLQRYNKKTYSKEWETALTIKDKNLDRKNWHPKQLCYLKGGQLYVYVPAADKKNKRGVLLRTLLSTDGKIKEDFKEVGSLNEEFITSRYFDTQSGIFQFAFSPDSSKMVFSVTYYINGRGSQQDISTVDITNGKKLCEKEVYVSYKKEGGVYNLESYTIDNSGKLVYGYIYEDKDGSKGFAVNVFDPATNSEKTITPNFAVVGKAYMEVSDLMFTKENKLLFTTILTDVEKQKGKKQNSSIFVTLIDPITGKSLYEASQYFTEEWRAKYEPAQWASGGATGHSKYDFEYTFIPDGSLIISGFKRGGWNAPPKHGSNCLDDAVITKISKAGKIDWIRTMPIRVVKRDFWSKDGVENYVNLFFRSNKIYYVFDDKKSNEKIDLTKVETSKYTDYTKDPVDGDVNTTCITMDMSGNMQRTFIANNKEFGFYPLDKLVWIDGKLLLYYKDGHKSEQFSLLSVQ